MINKFYILYPKKKKIFFMSENHAGFEIMVEFGMNNVYSIVPMLPENKAAEAETVFRNYLSNICDFDTSCTLLASICGRADPLLKVKSIIELPPTPLPNFDNEPFDGDTKSGRKKTRTWSAIEDNRLLAGVYHFGPDNWKAVSTFLGSGRNRAQCSQRWTRCLNPHISKKNWSEDENNQLKDLVKTYGDKAWTKISAIMGTRSDVQCRYHYKQLMGGDPLQLDKSITQSSYAFNIKKSPDTTFSPSPPPGKPMLEEPEEEIQISLGETRTRANFVAQSSPNMFRMRSINDLITIPFVQKQCGIVGGGVHELDGFLRNFL